MPATFTGQTGFSFPIPEGGLFRTNNPDMIYQRTATGIKAFPTRAGIGPGAGFNPVSGIDINSLPQFSEGIVADLNRTLTGGAGITASSWDPSYATQYQGQNFGDVSQPGLDSGTQALVDEAKRQGVPMASADLSKFFTKNAGASTGNLPNNFQSNINDIQNKINSFRTQFMGNPPPSAGGGNTISTDSLTKPPPSLTLPSGNNSGADSNYLNTINSLYSGLKSSATTQAENERATYEASLKSDLATMGNRSARTAELYKTAGISDNLTKLNDLNNQIAAKMAGIGLGEAKIGGQPIPQDLLVGQQAEFHRQQLADVGVLQATAAATQGNIELSKQLIDQTINFEFAPIEQRINSMKELLSLNSQDLTRAEKKDADKLDLMLKFQDKMIAQAKDDRTQVTELLVKYPEIQSKGITRNSTVDAAIKAATPFIQRDQSLTRQSTQSLITQRGGGTSGTGGNDLASAILQNPEQYNSLSPTDKSKILPTLAAQGFKFPKKLSPNQQQAAVNADSALLALSNLKNTLIKSDGSVDWVKLLGAKTGFGQTATDLREAADVITRIRTGAALNASEQVFYAKQVPRLGDSADVIQHKINQLGALYAGVSGSPVILKSPDGRTYSFEDMFNPAVRLEVKTALENGYNLVQF